MKKLCILAAFMFVFLAFAPLFAAFNSTTVNGDVIVTDTETDLVWQKTYVSVSVNDSSKTWKDALSYCEDLTYAGYSDWHLPNKTELASLVNYAKYDPASDFPDMPSLQFCSSTTALMVNSGLSYAWGVEFKEGKINFSIYKPGLTNGTIICYVRCVRQ